MNKFYSLAASVAMLVTIGITSYTMNLLFGIYGVSVAIYLMLCAIYSVIQDEDK